MGLTTREKQLRNTAEFLRAGGIKARVSGNMIKVKSKRGLQLAREDRFVRKFNIKVSI